jgi:hypothetical protein
MRRLSEKQWQSLASAVARELKRVAPDWTALNLHDPGITVLEALAYALTDLQYRTHTIDTHGRMLARRVAQLAHWLADESGVAGEDGEVSVTGAGDCTPGLQRVNYFTGQLLSADDLTTEQDYVRNKFHRRNRAHGTGVVTGLEVTLKRTGSKTQVVIAPGLAFNARGEEIEVSAPTPLPLPAQGKALLVLLHYAEQPCRPVPALVTDPQATAEEQVRFSRVTETFSATLAPSTDDSAVALARLSFSRGRWALDRKFKAAQVR